jgi:predicted secreted hydrolase
LLQGDRGYSRKGPGAASASYYYSQPQLRVSGTVTLDGQPREVQGTAWLDHEWSSELIEAEARGWDWMGVNLADGGALMAFRMRDAAGGARWSAATLRNADGTVRTFGPGEVEWTPLRHWRSPRTGARYPVQWRVRVGDQTYRVEPLMDDAELDSRSSTGTIYWEGPITLQNAAEAAHAGQAAEAARESSGAAGTRPGDTSVTRSDARAPLGRGYLELTGYAGRLDL